MAERNPYIPSERRKDVENKTTVKQSEADHAFGKRETERQRENAVEAEKVRGTSPQSEDKSSET
jgi:hypothetical protein